MTKGLLKAVILPTLIAIAMTTVGVPNASAQDGWEFDLAIYGWLPTIEGKLAYEIPELGDTIEVDPADLLDNLQFTAMVGFAANHGKWSILGDVIYLKEAASQQRAAGHRRSGLNLSADFELKAWITSFGGAYEVASSRRSTLGVLVGVRYFSTDTRLVCAQYGPLDSDAPWKKSATCGTALSASGAGSGWRITGSCPITWTSAPAIPTSRGRLCRRRLQLRWGSLVLLYRYLDFDQGDGAWCAA